MGWGFFQARFEAWVESEGRWGMGIAAFFSGLRRVHGTLKCCGSAGAACDAPLCARRFL